MSARVNNRTRRHEGRVFVLETENVTLDNGVTVDIDILRHPGAAAIVPVTDTGGVILIDQYRHAIGTRIWEIPAGTLNDGEAPEDCARRELIEETGVSAGRFEKLGEITPVPGYADERIHLFLATDLTPARQQLDPDEVLQVHEVAFAEALAMIEDGRIQDAKTICGLLMAQRSGP